MSSQDGSGSSSYDVMEELQPRRGSLRDIHAGSTHACVNDSDDRFDRVPDRFDSNDISYDLDRYDGHERFENLPHSSLVMVCDPGHQRQHSPI